MKIEPGMLFIDSGAPVLYNRFARGQKSGRAVGLTLAQRQFDSQEYVESKYFRDYLARHIEYCGSLGESERLLVAALDVLNNPVKSQEIWNMEVKARPSIIPTWHVGEPECYLEYYLRKGVPFLALGGMMGVSINQLHACMNRVWNRYLLNSDGSPKIKVHGFAFTSYDLLERYPFYSVDSTAAMRHGIYGEIIVFNSSFTRNKIIETSLHENILRHPEYIFNCSKSEQEYIFEYINRFGYEMGRGEVMDNTEENRNLRPYTIFNKDRTKIVSVIEDGLAFNSMLRVMFNLDAIEEWKRRKGLRTHIFASGLPKDSGKTLKYDRLVCFMDLVKSDKLILPRLRRYGLK